MYLYVFVCICIYLYACRRSENLNRKPFDKSNSCREALHTIDKSRQHLSFDMHAKVDSRSTQLASILHLSFRNLFCRGCRYAAEHFIIVSPSCLMAALVACWSLQPFNTRLWHDGRSVFFPTLQSISDCRHKSMTRVLSIFGVRPSICGYKPANTCDIMRWYRAILFFVPVEFGSYLQSQMGMDVRQMGMEESTSAMGVDIGSGQHGTARRGLGHGIRQTGGAVWWCEVD